MSKRLGQIICLIAIWIGLNQAIVLACPCWDQLTPSESWEAADVIFAGRMIASSREAWRGNRIKLAWRPPFIHLIKDRDRYRSTFKVTKVWKGGVNARTHVIHSISDCASYSFQQGEEYIVYARWFKGELRTGGVYRNNLLSDASEDLAAFGMGKPPTQNPPSMANFIGKLTAVFLLLSLLGWAAWQARRKYGVQTFRNHEPTHFTC